MLSTVLSVVALILICLALVGWLLYDLHTSPVHDGNGNPMPGLGLQPVEFPEVTTIIAKDQPEYRPLPAYVARNPDGNVITCWQANFWHRVKFLITGKLWVNMLTFNKPVTPIYFSVNKFDLLVEVEPEKQPAYTDDR